MTELSGRNWRVIVGDVRDGLRTLPDNSVQLCVTSPPYWGLRDYNVEGQLGLEPTPELYVANMVAVFEEVRRVLRPDGTCWVNIGDSYQSAKGQAGGIDPKQPARRYGLRPNDVTVPGLKPKDLVGIPWRLAFALQSAGWWLRSEIIWYKRSPMPETVTDRPTKSHEQIFLLTKSAEYFFDQEAVKEQAAGGAPGNVRPPKAAKAFAAGDQFMRTKAAMWKYDAVETRNLRTVWTLSSEPFPGAHFATFPSTIPERCIKAGTSERGACPACRSPWERIVERTKEVADTAKWSRFDKGKTGVNGDGRTQEGERFTTKSTGWQPTCKCGHAETVPCVVLDPFSGSGTTGMVATELGREYIGIELNPAYAEMSRARIESWKQRDAAKAAPSLTGQRYLFEEATP